MVASVEPKESVSRKHREALALHQTRCVEADLELADVENVLPQAEPDEADELLRRKRELLDKVEWLGTQTAAFERKAQAETRRETILAANTAWSPLAQERAELLGQADAVASQLGELLTQLDGVAARQAAVLDKCGSLDELRSSSIVQDTRQEASRYFRIYLLHKLNLLAGDTIRTSGLPPAYSPAFGQDRVTSERLFATPPEVK